MIDRHAHQRQTQPSGTHSYQRQSFRSFWMAGFEAACHIVPSGRRNDLITATQHDQQADGDYAMLREIGIATARDAVRWHLIEKKPGHYDFSSLERMAAAARRHGVEVIWTLCHYGWPDDLDLLAPAFVDRFARFCRAVARFFAETSDEPQAYIPINEISFLAWCIGDVATFHPFARGKAPEIKRQLVRAAIAGCEAIWDVDPRARILHVDPLLHVTPTKTGQFAEEARLKRENQFEGWDMLIGRREPELGGHPRYLQTMGLNYYYPNQMEYPDNRLRWEETPRDPRWVPLHRLLEEVYKRYGRPILIAETSHLGLARGPWIREIAEECCLALRRGVPLEGVCLFPIIDRPDWEDPEHWHNSGLWELVPDVRGTLQRKINLDYAKALREAQARVAAELSALGRAAA